MRLSNLRYQDVEESFGMGGPYLGTLEFNGEILNRRFLANGEKLSLNKTKIVLAQYSGNRNDGILGLSLQRVFHIVVYDEVVDEFYQSIDSFESLTIEKMEGNLITFHEAFHTSLNEFKRTVKFTEKNFNKMERDNIIATKRE
ncbi:hypothetical protein KFE98_00460 [bacterium SCSIO 12741]|nr:hypothetical protein KFE98_00460 [bacterium SCSIO 12741]